MEHQSATGFRKNSEHPLRVFKGKRDRSIKGLPLIGLVCSVPGGLEKTCHIAGTN